MGFRRQHVARSAGMLLALTTLGACNHLSEAPDVERGTLLDAPADEGGVSILQPLGHPSWSGSFSGLPLCLTAEDRAVRIKSFQPLESYGTVDELRAMLVTPREKSLPFMSALGAAPAFAEAYATDERRYAQQLRFEPDLAGVEITEVCSATAPEELVSLAVSFATDQDGGQIREWELIYESDGEEFTTGPIPWEMTLCGTDPHFEAVC